MQGSNGYGAVNGLLRTIRYDQTKCFVDVFLKDLKDSKQLGFWLETCNVHAIACAVEAVGATFRYELPLAPDGAPVMSQAGLMFTYLYSRYGQANAPVVSDGVAENEVFQNLAWIAEQCANVTAIAREFKSPALMVDAMKASLRNGCALALSYKTDYGSGHYHAVTWVNAAGNFLAYDSWAANKHCKNNGIQEEYPVDFYVSRCNPDRLRFIEIRKK